MNNLKNLLICIMILFCTQIKSSVKNDNRVQNNDDQTPSTCFQRITQCLRKKDQAAPRGSTALTCWSCLSYQEQARLYLVEQDTTRLTQANIALTQRVFDLETIANIQLQTINTMITSEKNQVKGIDILLNKLKN